MGKLLPIILILVGLGGGGAAGFVLRPEPAPPTEEELAEDAEKASDEEEEPSTVSFVKLNNQFVVPVVVDDKVAALVVLSMSLEVDAAQTELVYNREPKIRDGFLRVLFDHAYAGGFHGAFTASPNLDVLTSSLLKVARQITDEAVTEVLITDIVRQDH